MLQSTRILGGRLTRKEDPKGNLALVVADPDTGKDFYILLRDIRYGGYPTWIAPTLGDEDTYYNTTDRVTWNFDLWESLVDDNTAIPSEGANWTKVSDDDDSINYFRGYYLTLIALQTAHPTATAGSYALVDTGVGNNAQTYVWDMQDGWVLGSGGLVNFASATEINTGTNAVKAIAPNQLAASDYGKVKGKQDMFVPASAMWPRNSGGCSSLTRVEMSTSFINVQGLSFAKASIQYAQFKWTPPRNWNPAIGLKLDFEFYAASSGGDVVWGAQAVALSDADAYTNAFGTAQEVVKSVGTSNTFRRSAQTASITISGSPAKGDTIFIQVYRKSTDASDTSAVAVVLTGVNIECTVDAGIAA